jgi:hypothetical protein
VNLRDGSVAAASGVQESEIEQQVGRLLSDNRFRNGKRLPSFLRFVVNETIQGRSESLKERTIGAAVFGRPVSYDTAGDPIVRVAAAELRKRLAQYYQDPGHESEIRIHLPIGSYVPCFESTSSTTAGRNDDIDKHSSEKSTSGRDRDSLPTDRGDVDLPVTTDSRHKRALSVLAGFGLLVLICAAGTSFFFTHRMKSPLEEFWAPVLNSSDAITFFLPYLPNQQNPNALASQQIPDSIDGQQMPRPGMNAVVLTDFRSYVTLAGFLESRHRNLTYKSSNTSTIADLETGPAILIGAFDNPWALRLSSALRFHFGTNPDMQEFWIEDSLSHPANRWSVDRKLQATNNFCDYALVARFLDQDTGKLVVLVAGITGEGTTAASKFITEPDQFSRIPGAPRNWAQKNVEVVLKIQIIDRVPATPTVVAAYFW